MTDTASLNYQNFKLPLSIVTRPDVSRLVSEIEQLDSEIQSNEVRARSGVESADTQTSVAASDFLEINNLTLNDDKIRQNLIKQLRELKSKAPKVHASFAVPADHESLVKLVAWFRESINPQIVLEVGLQPDLIAGVYLRTDNHVHDFSLRSSLTSHHDMLVSQLKELA